MITLPINGREMTFSREELIAIIEEHFREETAKTAKAEVRAKPTKVKATDFEVAQAPTEGKCFEVNPMEIDRSLFQEKRSDSQQEHTRQYILEAFDEVDKHPERYAKSFKTLRPKKTWDGYKTVRELKQYAKKLGGHHGNKTEKALEWAQRLNNGEAWEAICNDPDTAEWYELVDWKNGYSKVVGGSRNYNYPATYVSNFNYHSYDRIKATLPFVVFS